MAIPLNTEQFYKECIKHKSCHAGLCPREGGDRFSIQNRS